MARLQNSSRDIKLFVSRTLSTEARQKVAAAAARKILAGAQEANRRVLGRVPDHKTFVDGRANAPLESVNTDHGKIVFQFDIGIIDEMLRWIGEQLVLHSPVLTGTFARSHVLLADGVEIDADGKIPQAENYIFVNTQPYARKIERGQSDQTPDGVYEVVAALAKNRFGNIANIRFTFRSTIGAFVALGGKRGGRTVSAGQRAAADAERVTRNPAISVTPR